ncbi:hypothetical protein [Rhizobium sp. AB2/73]|uniref:hypothetical protein n=1 Tax=Rhizobium sp. AB2/73 TaxID=2795216 RepID=UPI000DE0C1C0|nr:hypothetical protein [Rhizobium sp. AB2/73]QYA17454.1 hypothetical protein J5284_33840 [Rhizobium sp. AB2/73]UEQ85775.1 hypothetical protein I8E17_33820 [Rhizobium sp. AB2/73]
MAKRTKLKEAILAAPKLGARASIVIALGASLMVSVAEAADTCSTLKTELSSNGTYIHHFSDPARPSIDLYERYVSSSLQCNANEQAHLFPVTMVAGCELPRCMAVGAQGHH